MFCGSEFHKATVSGEKTVFVIVCSGAKC